MEHDDWDATDHAVAQQYCGACGHVKMMGGPNYETGGGVVVWTECCPSCDPAGARAEYDRCMAAYAKEKGDD